MVLQSLSTIDPDRLEPGTRDEDSERRPRKRRKRRSKLRWLGIVAGVLLCTLPLISADRGRSDDVPGPRHCLALQDRSGAPAVQALQSRADNVAKLSGALPTTGVYTYSTTGTESASAPGLPTNTQGYPSTTTMTVFSDGCGQDWSWQPLSNRYEDLVVCRSPDGAIALGSRFDAEEFYGAPTSEISSARRARFCSLRGARPARP